MKRPGENRLFLIGFFCVLVVIGAWFGLRYYAGILTQNVETLDTALIELDRQVDAEAQEKLETFSKQSMLMSELLDSHVFWTRAIEKISALMNAQVQVENLTVSLTRKSVSLTAIAANYSTIARQIAAFSSGEGVTDIEIGTIESLPNGRLKFTVQLEIDQHKLFAE